MEDVLDVYARPYPLNSVCRCRRSCTRSQSSWVSASFPKVQDSRAATMTILVTVVLYMMVALEVLA